MLARLLPFVVAVAGGACAHAAPPAVAHAPEPGVPDVAVAPSPPALAAAMAPDATPPTERWYFEWLSSDGQRALLRRIDGGARSTFDARVVDVDSGATVDETVLGELATLPTTTIGSKPADAAHLEATLASPELGADLVRGAEIASSFPFGSCGRFSAAKGGGAIAFNAGDWLYLADATGHVRRRVVDVAAYDGRFTPDGKHLVYRQASGRLDRVLAKYELFVVPSDLSGPPRVLPGTAGAWGAFGIDEASGQAVVIASHEPQIQTCALGVALRPPFAVKPLVCFVGEEQLVEVVVSPKGRWIAVTTQTERADGQGLAWRLRVASLERRKILIDAPIRAGVSLRAISDTGVLVESDPLGAIVLDVPGKKRYGRALDLGHRAFFRSATDLVYVRGASVAVVDVGG